MHPDPTFAWTDRAAMRAFVEHNAFGMVCAVTPEGPRVAHVTVLWLGEDRLAFHIANSNDVRPHLLRGDLLFVANGDHAYISPDWYEMPEQVPTWNYLSVELTGQAEPMTREALVALMHDLSAAQEAALSPKRPWTIDKMTPARFDAMLNAITGYVLHVSDWRGTRKLGQNKPVAARLAVAERLEERGDIAMAGLMRSSLS